MPYVVESQVEVRTPFGTVKTGTARVYVETEARAQEIVAALPAERTYREIALTDMPPSARANMEKANATA